jgi:hypothetical protein
LVPGPAVFADPFVAAIAGLLLASLGQVIRATTIGLEYIVRGGRNHRVYADALVTEGLFRLTRNPMYVGKFFMVLGAGVASNRWPAMLGISAAYAFMYGAIVRAEEAYLRQKFGPAFDDYVRRVPRWFPRLHGLAQIFSQSKFRWSRVLLKEYSAPLGWALPIVLIGLYNLRQAGGPDPRPYATMSLLGVLGMVLVFWVVIGWLKKTGSPALRLTGN